MKKLLNIIIVCAVAVSLFGRGVKIDKESDFVESIEKYRVSMEIDPPYGFH